MAQDFVDAIFLSYKASGDLKRSPKGRATTRKTSVHRNVRFKATSYDSLPDRFGCKACVSQSPINIIVPKMRNRFYARYYAYHRRPILHHLLNILEPVGLVLRAASRVSNMVMRAVEPFLRHLGVVDLPWVYSVCPSADGAPQVFCVVRIMESLYRRRWLSANPHI